MAEGLWQMEDKEQEGNLYLWTFLHFVIFFNDVHILTLR